MEFQLQQYQFVDQLYQEKIDEIVEEFAAKLRKKSSVALKISTRDIIGPPALVKKNWVCHNMDFNN